MESTNHPSSRSFQDYLIESFQRDPENAAGYLTAIFEEPDPEPELLAAALDDVAIAIPAVKYAFIKRRI
jgi:DNA-binding phage protein